MQFTTKIPIAKSLFEINYNSKIALIGSCFSENIGAKFDYFRFQNMVNPFGIIFNAVAIENLISRIVAERYFAENDVFFHNDLWHCYEIHSNLSYPERNILINNLNKTLTRVRNFFAETTHFIFTFGTSWVYKTMSNSQTVANCHKMPQKDFNKDLLSIEQTQKSMSNIIAMISNINPKAQIIFTISPVRHIKDGFFENNVSKAVLLQSIFEIKKVTKTSQTFEYFPSFEIINDELRDYRFFETDMIHPNQFAIDYVWQQFVQTYINENQYALMRNIDNIQKMLLHRPSNTISIEYQKLLSKIKLEIQNVQKIIPEINFKNK